jgi:hypothetical protein
VPIRVRVSHARPHAVTACCAAVPAIETVVDRHEVACYRWRALVALPAPSILTT